jgi:hypothetical protein
MTEGGRRQRRTSNIDDLVKSRKYPFSVIPAKAGIQYFRAVADIWNPACAGMTTFYGGVNIRCSTFIFLVSVFLPLLVSRLFD